MLVNINEMLLERICGRASERHVFKNFFYYLTFWVEFWFYVA